MIPFFDQFVLFFKNLSYLCSVIGEKSNDEGSILLGPNLKTPIFYRRAEATISSTCCIFTGVATPSLYDMAGNYVDPQFIPKGDWRCLD